MTSNEIMKEELNKEVLTLSDKSEKILEELNQNIDSTFTAHIDNLSEETTKTIQKLNEIQNNAQKRFESYYNRKRVIDYLVYANLVITPILFIVITYLTFVKK